MGIKALNIAGFIVVNITGFSVKPTVINNQETS